jgi:hypothetical protein
MWQVVAPVVGPSPQGETSRPPVALRPGTLLRHDQSDGTIQGYWGAECWVLERFAILDGPDAGRCVEFSMMDPGEGESAIPAEIQPASIAAARERAWTP